MDTAESDISDELMLDGNAAAGILYEVFGVEMTVAPTECATCGYSGDIATLAAFMHGPGVVLRCPGCENVMLRITITPSAIYLDARGAAYLRLARNG